MDKRVKLLPMDKISKEVRDLAVNWVENFKPIGGMMIEDKHKLASDIQNIADLQSEQAFIAGADWNDDCHIYIQEDQSRTPVDFKNWLENFKKEL